MRVKNGQLNFPASRGTPRRKVPCLLPIHRAVVTWIHHALTSAPGFFQIAQLVLLFRVQPHIS